MAEKTLTNIRIINKHDTEANWVNKTDFIPKQGELIIYDVDSAHTYQRFKIGDGITTVNNLPFGGARPLTIEEIDIAIAAAKSIHGES